jgi:hypothetical protein
MFCIWQPGDEPRSLTEDRVEEVEVTIRLLGVSGMDIQLKRKQLTQMEYRLLGFLSGSFLAAGGMYFYVLQEYKVSNELLTEDIYVSFPLPPILFLAALLASLRV